MERMDVGASLANFKPSNIVCQCAKLPVIGTVSSRGKGADGIHLIQLCRRVDRFKVRNIPLALKRRDHPLG